MHNGSNARRLSARMAVATAVVTLLLAVGPPASADTAVKEGKRTLTVSQSADLPVTGAVVEVTGSGYDVSKGIYVAVCVDTGAGNVPTPCLGGVDMTGDSGGSQWISSNPPSYGVGLAKPYGTGGTFAVSLSVIAVDKINGTDCRVVKCAIVTRSDHTRTSDRSQDVRIPISFGGVAAVSSPTSSSLSSSSRSAPSTSSGGTSSTVTTSPRTASSAGATSTSASRTSAEARASTNPGSAVTKVISTFSSPATVGTSAPGSRSVGGMVSAAPSSAAVVSLASESSPSGTAWIWWVVGVVLVLGLVAVAVVRRRKTS